MDIRKVQLMKELQREYYREKGSRRGFSKVQKEGIVICLVLLGMILFVMF